MTSTKALAGALLPVYLTGLFIVLWAPYKFIYPLFFGNAATWQEGRVEFQEPGSLRSAASAGRLVDRFLRHGAFGVEIVLTSLLHEQTGSILTLSDPSVEDRYNIVVGQRRDDLVVRIRTTRNVFPELRRAARAFRNVYIEAPWKDSSRKELGRDLEHPRILVRNLFSTREERQIVVAYDGNALEISGDGEVYFSALVRDEQFPANWDREYFIHLGNEANGRQPWLGQIARLRFFDSGLANASSRSDSDRDQGALAPGLPLPAAELQMVGDALAIRDGEPDPAVTLPLVKPTLIVRTTKDFLNASAREIWSIEGLLNVILFMPLGALLAIRKWPEWAPGARPALYVAGLGCSLSLSAEIGQFFIAERYSSLDDVLVNTVGAVLGWLIVSARLRASRADPEQAEPGSA